MAEEEAKPTTTQRIPDPFRNYNFKLLVGNDAWAHFTYISGIEAEVEAIRYREGGANQITYRMPGPVSYGDVTLHYGLTADRRCFDWFMKAVEGRVKRENVSIALVDADGSKEVVRWDLIDAWPKAWRGSDLQARGKEVAVESVTLVFETLKRTEPGAKEAPKA